MFIKMKVSSSIHSLYLQHYLMSLEIYYITKSHFRMIHEMFRLNHEINFNIIHTSRTRNIKRAKNNSLCYTFYDQWNVQRRNPKQEFKIDYDTTNQTKGISYYISKASKICQEGEVFNEQKCSPFSLVYFLTMRYRLFVLIGVNPKCPVIKRFLLRWRNFQ